MSLKPPFTCFVKPPDYVPTARAVVTSGFKPALVCAVRERVTPQPRPPYLPPPPEPPAFPDFVWGDPWSFTMPVVAGATFYIEHIGPYPGSYDVSIPSYATANTVGDYGYTGREWSGTTEQNSILGPTRVWIDGWSALADDPNYPENNLGPSLDVTVNTYFRIYWGDWDGALPAEFTAEDILGLTHGGVAGPSTRLCTVARNQELQFSVTGTAKARVIVTPVHVDYNAYPFGLQAGVPFNTLRAEDHTQKVLDPSVDTPYQGGPATGYNMLVINGVQHFVYVVPATVSAFSVWLRYVETEVRNLGTTYPANPTFNPLGVCYKPGNWTFNSPCAQFDPAEKLLVSVSASTNLGWSGALQGENHDSVAHVYTISMDTSLSFNLDGFGEFSLLSTSRSRGPQALSAFDGAYDGSGSSGWSDANHFQSAGFTTTDLTAHKSLFVGTGTVDFNIDRSETLVVLADGVDVTNNSAVFFNGICSTVHSAFLQVTFTYFLL